uniref:RHS repeat domain-containing protein n=1 Tax=Escherichia coli TaxID=562 RepID=UPI0010F824D7
GELAAVYDRSNTQVRSFTYDDKYRGRMVAHRHTGRPEIRYRYDSDGRVTEQLNPAGLSYTYQYEKDRITITDSLNRREVLHTQGEAGLKRVVKKEHADGSVTQSQFDAVGRLKAQTDAAGRTTEYSPDVVTGLITRITTPDGRASAFYYNHHSQLTSATGPDGLEMRRKYDEYGRLIQETAPDGDITRYRYDNPHSDLPCATDDATGSRKTMTWSRYGQLLTFTDCSGYVTRYDHDRFGQVTAVHREEGLSQYHAYDSRGQLTAVKDTQGHETRYEYNIAGDLTAVIAPDGSRNGTQYDAWGKAICTTQGGLTRSMEYDAAGRVIRLTSENGSHTTFRYDVLDRLTTIQNDRSRIQTIYQPGSFTPLIRVETATGEQAKTQRRSLADALQQSGGEDGGSVVFPPVLVQMLDRLESEILADRVSEESRRWLASCGLTVEQMQNQMDPVYTPARKIHLYHCDHRGLPLALISTEGATAWCAEYDEWGNLLNEENPHQLQQLIRLPGQQYDEESGLYYNRHRYYDPLQGRYITQDPIGLKGGWNLYGYQLNPISDIDPLGLSMWEDAKSGACTNGLCGTLSAMIGPDKFDSIDSTAYDALNKINSQSICEDKEFAGLICKDNSGRYFSTAPNRGERKGSYPFNSPCPNGTEKVSAYHTHGADSHGEYWDEIFSGKDEKIVKSKDNNIKSFYLGTPSGNFKAIDNHGKEITNRKGLPNVCRVHGNM